MAGESTPTTTTTVPDVPSTIPPSGSSGQQPNSNEDFATKYQNYFDQAWVYLKTLPLKERLDLLEELRMKGFNSGSAVSPRGTDTTDIDRVRQVLMYQETLNLPASTVILPQVRADIKNWPTKATTGTGSKRTPGADLDAYLTSVMQTKLGRSPRADEMEKFRKAYAAMEAGGNEPTVGTAAGEQVKTSNPGEYEASQFASFASTFEDMLRGA